MWFNGNECRFFNLLRPPFSVGELNYAREHFPFLYRNWFESGASSWRMNIKVYEFLKVFCSQWFARKSFDVALSAFWPTSVPISHLHPLPPTTAIPKRNANLFRGNFCLPRQLPTEGSAGKFQIVWIQARKNLVFLKFIVPSFGFKLWRLGWARQRCHWR